MCFVLNFFFLLIHVQKITLHYYCYSQRGRNTHTVHIWKRVLTLLSLEAWSRVRQKHGFNLNGSKCSFTPSQVQRTEHFLFSLRTKADINNRKVCWSFPGRVDGRRLTLYKSPLFCTKLFTVMSLDSSACEPFGALTNAWAVYEAEVLEICLLLSGLL